MTLDELIALLREKEITEQTEITPDSRLEEDLLLNSFSDMLLLVTLERTLNIKLDAQMLSDVKTVRELHARICQICAEKGNPS